MRAREVMIDGYSKAPLNEKEFLYLGQHPSVAYSMKGHRSGPFRYLSCVRYADIIGLRFSISDDQYGYLHLTVVTRGGEFDGWVPTAVFEP